MNTEQPTTPAAERTTAQLKGTYVTTKGGTVENFTPRINGKIFRCSCGCNVFSKPNDQNLDLYECNGCGALYEAE